MPRKILWAALALVVILAAIAYFNRDSLIDASIRDKLAQKPDAAFLAKDGHIRVLLCGTGSPEASAAKAQACTLVSAGGRMFLFDVGDGAVRSLEHSHVPLNKLERVFITHFHSDHFNDLGTLINAGWIWGRNTPLEIEGPVGMRTIVAGFGQSYALDESYRSANMPHLAERREVAFGTPLEVVFAEGKRMARVYDRDGVTIDAVLVVHDPVKPALGYILRHRGKKIFVSGDTEVSPLNLEAMRGADLAVHESYAAHMVRRAIPQMKKLGMDFEAEVATRTIPYHADNIALAKQAQSAGVKHLLLTHLIPYPDGFVMRRMYTEGMANHYEGKLTVGQDGMLIIL